jgi:tetratricopeptide (TPR) repeat protein
VAYDALLLGADWRHAPLGYREPRYDKERKQFVVELTQVRGDDEAWPVLRKAWLRLPVHPNVVTALEAAADDGLVIQFAAVDWLRPLAGAHESELLASWGVQIALAYAHVARNARPERLGAFFAPAVHIDLGGHARVSFRPCLIGEVAPVQVVQLIATQIAMLADDIMQFAAKPLGGVLARASTGQIPTPIALYRELAPLQAGNAAVRHGTALAGWRYFEEAIGWRLTGNGDRAARCFEAALELGCQMTLAQVGRASALVAIDPDVKAWRPRTRDPRRREQLLSAALRAWKQVTDEPWNASRPMHKPWDDEIREAGEACEAIRAFTEATVHYHRAHACIEKHLALARCSLSLDRPGHAVEYATRVLDVDAERYDARWLRVRAHLGQARPQLAMADAKDMITRFPGDGVPRYLLGRCLLALGRHTEAQAEFDRACTLSPKLLEAMLLRREAGRAIGNIRKDVGEQPAQQLDVPAHLIEVRIALAVGDVDAAIAQLADHAYLADPEAQRTLGQLLMFAGRYAEALAAFLRAPDSRAAQAGADDARLALDPAYQALG